jgi:hypothetical protein
MTDFINPTGLASRGLPSPAPGDNVRGPIRTDLYGDQVGISLLGGRMHALADEGTYFYSQHPTIDAATTVAGHAAPVLADLYTKPFLVVSNNDVSGSRKRTYLDFILITVITPGTGGTSDNWAAECDTGARYSSGTLVRLTTVNPNMQSTNTNAAVLDTGPYVASAASSAQRKMGSGVFRPSIAIAGDQYLFVVRQPGARARWCRRDGAVAAHRADAAGHPRPVGQVPAPPVRAVAVRGRRLQGADRSLGALVGLSFAKPGRVVRGPPLPARRPTMQFYEDMESLASTRHHRMVLQGGGNGVAPSMVIGHGMTFTWLATGRVKITWAENPGTFAGIGAGFFRDNASQATVKNWEVTGGAYPATASTFTLEIDIWNAAGAAADLATTSFLDLDLVFSELKTP